MNPQRRALLLAGLALAIAVIALIVALTTGGNGSHDATPGPTPTPSAANARPARDRQQIAQVAESFQRALDPKSTDNPCRFMTRAAQASALEQERQAILEGPHPTQSIGSCADVVRRRKTTNKAVPLYRATPPGVTDIEFRHSVPSARAGGTEPGAIARWKAAGYGQVSFVRDDSGQWRIAE
jgi:hypothetical protein